MVPGTKWLRSRSERSGDGASRHEMEADPGGAGSRPRPADPLHREVRDGEARSLHDPDAEAGGVEACLDCFDLLAALSSEAVLVHSDERIVYANQAGVELLGARSPQELRGLAMGDFVRPGDLPALEARRAQALEGAPLPAENWQVVSIDGIEKTVRVTSRPVTHRGRPARVTLAADITQSLEVEEERSRLRDRLEVTHRAESLGRLAGGVAHDFNNLLTVISGSTDLALSELAEESKLTEHLRQIESATERAAALIRQLLAFGRRQVLRPSVVDLNDVVAEMESMLRRLIRSDIEIRFERRAGACPVRVDRGQLEQVIVNLVVNARDAMPQGGVVVVATESGVPLPDSAPSPGGGCRTVLSVTDDGVGMDEETVSRIFEPFYTTKPVGSGTGLGLATVYGIVKQSGGAIDVESEPGVGTRFRIWLPTADS